jgi:hypothetical protein
MDAEIKPFALSLSRQERLVDSPSDKLRVNGILLKNLIDALPGLIFPEDFLALPPDGRRQDDDQQDDSRDQKAGADGPGDQESDRLVRSARRIRNEQTHRFRGKTLLGQGRRAANQECSGCCPYTEYPFHRDLPSLKEDTALGRRQVTIRANKISFGDELNIQKREWGGKKKRPHETSGTELRD